MTARLFDVNATLGRQPTVDVGAGDVAALLEVMDRLGVQKSVVAHSHAWRHDSEVGNALVLQAVAHEPRLLPCWVLLPDSCGSSGDIGRTIARACEAGVCAVRIYPLDHGYDVEDEDATAMFSAVSEAGLVLLVDAEQLAWPAVERLAQRHPTLPIVVCNVGYRGLRQLTGVLTRAANVRVDLSYLSSHVGLEWLTARLGADRVLFGTGWPVRDPADAVTRLLLSELDDRAVADVGWRNLQRLLGEEGSA